MVHLRVVVAGLLAFFAALPLRADLPGYLKRPEPEARWEKRAHERPDGGGEVVELELVSQVWRGLPWRHAVRIHRPARVDLPGLAVLFIAGGTTGRPAVPPAAAALAREAGVTVAVLSNVPNQPLFGDRKEDDLIAHTFQEYVRSGDEEWPLLFPMTKAAVKAMDAVQELAAKEWGAKPERFVVTGASKRGWTTWLAGASDLRVAGIVPLVYDNLHLAPQMKHQVETWGGYSEKIGDYTARGLQALLDTDRGRALAAMVDPYAHRAALARIPKLIVNGTNDPYWPVDALTLYWDALEGEKAVLYVPNGDHAVADRPAVRDAWFAFVRRVGAGRVLPALQAETTAAGGAITLRLSCPESPASAQIWVARSATRDFRKATWEARPMRPDGSTTAGEVERPASGFTALFGEAELREGDRPFRLSTPVRIVGPDAARDR